MSEDGKPDLDRPVTVRDLMALAEQYHLTLAHITSCMIKASVALRVSDEEVREKEGKAIYDVIDQVITHLEDAGKVVDKICRDALEKDDV